MTDDDWAEVNAWIEYVHTGSDGFYIESRLVVALRDEVERLRHRQSLLLASLKHNQEQRNGYYELLQSMANVPDEHYQDACPFCDEFHDYTLLKHTDDCPITTARALVTKAP